jgi:hypothetical protein
MLLFIVPEIISQRPLLNWHREVLDLREKTRPRAAVAAASETKTVQHSRCPNGPARGGRRQLENRPSVVIPTARGFAIERAQPIGESWQQWYRFWRDLRSQRRPDTACPLTEPTHSSREEERVQGSR